MANVRKNETETEPKKTRKATTSAKKTSTSKVKKETKKVATAIPNEKKKSTKKSTDTNKKNKSDEQQIATTTSNTKASTTPAKRGRKKSSSVATKKQTTTRVRKSTSTKKKTVEHLEYYDLPYRYNETIIKLLAQTPKRLFVYWDISDSDREMFKLDHGDNFFETTRPVLIVHNIDKNYTFEVPINDFANSWYLDVEDTKCKYYIELGRRPISNDNSSSVPNNYVYITSSNTIETPNNHILFEKSQNMVYFRNVKTGETTSKNIATLSFIRNMGKVYRFYDMYKKMYPNENLEDFNNPSSSNF